MTMLLVVLMLFIAPQTMSPISAASVKLSPKPVAEFDMGKLRGVIRVLSWKQDGTALYLQTAELRSDALPKETFHYVINPSNGELKKVDAEPDWAVMYRQSMKWKSAPGDDAFVISLETETRKASATSTPMGGDYARGGIDVSGGSGTSAEAVASAAQQTQSGTANVMRLKGQTVGEWLNQPIVPGQTYGWGPQGSNLIAYAEPNNRQLMIMDKSGAKQKIGDTKGVYSPSFSIDARKLAWIELRGKKAVLVISDIAQ